MTASLLSASIGTTLYRKFGSKTCFDLTISLKEKENHAQTYDITADKYFYIHVQKLTYFFGIT